MMMTRKSSYIALGVIGLSALAVVFGVSGDRGLSGPGLLPLEHSVLPAGLRDRRGASHAQRWAARRPFGFTQNRGQWEGRVHFVARARDLTAFVLSDSLVIERVVASQGQGHVLRLIFEGASAESTVSGKNQQSAPEHFLLGKHRSEWIGNVPSFDVVSVQGIADGVDLVLREDPRREHGLEYDLKFAAGVDPATLVVRLEGATGPLRILESGALQAETSLDPLLQAAPVAWQTQASGQRTLLACAYRTVGPDRFGFLVEGRNARLPLTIDPGLDWSTYYGGTDGEVFKEVAVDASGGVVAVGGSRSVDLPGTAGAFDPTFNPGGFSPLDGVAVRFDGQGTLLWATYLGGNRAERIEAVVVAPNGDVLVGGLTASDDFPSIPGAFDPIKSPFGDAFVSRLAPDGSDLVASTFLGDGGFGIDKVRSLALAGNGDVVAALRVDRGNFPTTPGAFDTTHNSPDTGSPDAAVTRLDPQLTSLIYSTFLGGSSNDSARGLAVGPDDAVYVVGTALSTDFPTTPGAFQEIIGPGGGGFVTCLAPDGGSLIFSTYFTGTPRVVALGPLGDVYFAGTTTSFNLPVTPGAFDTSPPGPGEGPDGFVTRLDPTGSHLVYSTYLGGVSSFEDLEGLVVDSSGAAIVAGSTNSFNWPVTPGAYATSVNTVIDLFITKLSPDGSELYYSTFLGGSGIDSPAGEPTSIGLAPDGSVIVGTSTVSTDYPTTPGAFQDQLLGPTDLAITRLDLLPLGANKFGTSTAGCAGPLQIGITAMPAAGGSVVLTCLNAPRFSTRGVLVVASAPLATPVSISGADLWLDPSAIVAVHSVRANGVGLGELRVRVPNDPGMTAFVQFIWPDACAPGGVSASNALEVVVQ